MKRFIHFLLNRFRRKSEFDKTLQFVCDKLASMPDGPEKMELARKLFGRSHQQDFHDAMQALAADPRHPSHASAVEGK